ncbi:MAG: SDR family NAD(P)-dependent oxidoreductase [Bermanella sp.]
MSKKILLTGATDGIGLLTAKKLVSLGHDVLIHGRNLEKLKAVEEDLKSLEAGSVESFQADLSDFKDIKKLINEITSQHKHIDIIINNAGIYKTNTPITKDNLDVRFVVNTFAPYLLTKKLLPLMNSDGCVVNLSSAAQAPVDFNAMKGRNTISDQFSAYAQSKLALTMWSRHLALELAENGPAIIAVNPGSLLASKMVKEGFGVAGNDLNIGADILIKLALSQEVKASSGLYFDNDLGGFSNPHVDALSTKKCAAVVKAMDDILSI